MSVEAEETKRLVTMLLTGFGWSAVWAEEPGRVDKNLYLRRGRELAFALYFPASLQAIIWQRCPRLGNEYAWEKRWHLSLTRDVEDDVVKIVEAARTLQAEQQA